MDLMNIDLRKYLQHNHNQLTWKEKIFIARRIINAIGKIHDENAIHRDLHSGNILKRNRWFIGDLGFCGPVNKSSKSIYGNLPYVAPEVIVGKEYTFKSVFIVLAYLCGRFHPDNHLLLIMSMIIILQ